MSCFRSVPLLCVAALFLCAGCTPRQPLPPASSPEFSISQSAPSDEVSVPVMAPFTPTESTQPAPEPPPESAPQPIPLPPPETKEPAPPVVSEPLPPQPADPIPPETEADSVPLPDPTPAFPVLSDYDFSQPVPEASSVENDFFADAAFVGDSRMEGFYLYSGVKTGKKLTATGLSVFNLNKKAVLAGNGTHYTLPEALTLTQYAKIYLNFGVNELGYINESAFYDAYSRTIDTIRALQPNAVIYVQTMIPVNEGRIRASGGAGHLNNDRLRMYNDLIRKAAQEKQVPLLDLYSAFAVDGILPAEASRDGVHLTGDYCKKQLDYLKTHTVSFDALYSPSQPETEVPNHEATAAPDADALSDSVPDLLLPEAEQTSLSSEPAPDTSGV